MTPTSQLELHPDADSLNAFVEQALAGSEREQVLAHLATCSRCRQVIYLAQEAAETARPAWAPAARPEEQIGRWFRNWRLIWGPATALAALALVVVFHPRHTALAPELAKVAPQREEIAARPASPEPQVAGVAHTPAPAAAAKSASRKPNLSASRAAEGESATVATPSAPFPAELSGIASSHQDSNAALSPSVAPVPGLAQHGTMAQFKPEPASAPLPMDRQRTVGLVSGSVPPAQSSAAGFRSTADRVQASRAVSRAAAPPTEPQPMPVSNFAVAMHGPMAGALAPRDSGSIKLPSGLAAFSRATAQHHTLAIDLTGALFLSEDAGKNWEPVARQWTGRAVEVRVQQGLTVSTQPARGLELINDKGLVWVSADGKTWTMR
jgi:hypothetical protein